MIDKYLIVLFKNKERYKIIKKYRTYNNAFQLFSKKIKESEQVIYNVQTENGRDVSYEIALIERTNNTQLPLFKTDELGRNITMKLDISDHIILKINEYRIPEKIYDLQKNKKIDANDFIDKEFKTDTLKLVSKLNNKIIVQNDDNYKLFSLKSSEDSNRFLDNLQKHMIDNGKKNCLIVKDTSKEQKKYLYEILSNLGFDKKMLYRNSTTHLKDK
jgi:hypothetical protein